MRRAVLALGGTAAVLAALFSFKAHSLAAAAPTTSATPAAASPTPAKSATPVPTHTITGPAAMTKYGPMQVKVTVVGQRITQVTVVQRTGSGVKSQRIASFVIPKLTG
jgi:uncharacterized protein with FMN-binding domain